MKNFNEINLPEGVLSVLAEKKIETSTISGTGKDGRITKGDAIKAVPSMGTQGDGELNVGTSGGQQLGC